MQSNNNLIDWISNWFLQECNGDWEHENQIKIQTVSNPGWYIEIDLQDTTLEHIVITNDTIEESENDWYFYGIKDKKFMASGDMSKLNFLLSKFKAIVETHQ